MIINSKHNKGKTNKTTIACSIKFKIPIAGNSHCGWPSKNRFPLAMFSIFLHSFQDMVYLLYRMRGDNPGSLLC